MVVGKKDTAIRRSGRFFACPRSRPNRRQDQFMDAECSRMRTCWGQFMLANVACSLVIEAVACARTRIVRGHDCWRGLNADTDCLWMWKIHVHVLIPAESSPWTGHCHVHERTILTGYSACSPRLIRGPQVLRWRRGKACPDLNMMRNTLPPLLQQLGPPRFQLRGNRLNSGGLFDGVGFDASGLTFPKL